MLQPGDKLLVAHRRLYREDAGRYFVGRVEASEGGLVKVTGHSFVRDMYTGAMLEKTESRTKILSLSAGTLIVYQLPDQVAVETVTFDWAEDRLVMKDGQGFSMDLAEVAHRIHG